ncbi:MAG: hypothetical protein ACRDV3_09055 [Acidothermaceae bacterium]
MFEPPQPLLFGFDVNSEALHGSGRRSQHGRDIATLAVSAIDLGTKGVGGDGTPDCDRGRMHELVADELDAGGSLLEFSRKAAEI